MDIPKIENDIQTFCGNNNLDLSENSMLFADPINNSRFNKIKLMECFLEHFNLYEVNFANQAVLALYAHARLTGLVVDSSHYSTRVLPVIDGHYISSGNVSSSIAGSLIDERLERAVGNLPREFTAEQRRQMKHRVCYVNRSSDYAVKDETYKLPDGGSVTFKQEHLSAPAEVMFADDVSEENLSIQRLVHNSITSCELDLRRQLAENIVLQGGNTSFSGFASRFTKELKLRLPSGNKVKALTLDKKDRASTVWIGGSILASLSHSMAGWMKRSDYQEMGPQQLIARNRSLVE